MKLWFRACFALLLSIGCASTQPPANKVVVTALPPLSIGIAS